MNKVSLQFIPFLTALAFLLSSCGGETEVVESGTYTGVVDKVEPEKSEIYVETNDGERLELYFVKETVLIQQGDTVSFDNLAEGQRVEIKLEKIGRRLDPITVKILE